MDYRNYQDYQTNSVTPSMTSETPPPLRRGSTVADSIGQPAMNFLPQSGYDELDVNLQYSHFVAAADPHNPYGYVTGLRTQTLTQQVMHSPAASVSVYNPYEQHPPQGYLDSRPSYDDRNLYGQTQPLRVAGQPPPLTVFSEPTGGPLMPEATNGSNGDVRWRDPDLHEVIEFLSHPDDVIKANAAAYLQHLCFMDDNKKSRTRALGGIPKLIALLSHEVPDIQKNACGALRNLCYGRKNDENKRDIRNAGGIPALVKLLRKLTENHELRELVTGILWNLSSCEDLKKPILDDAVAILINQIIIPASGWDGSSAVDLHGINGILGHRMGEPAYWSTVFRNASGVIRNVSSAGEYARRKLRECDGIVDSLIFLVRAAISKNDMDNKSIENCVCILRNLSYRCQEVVDPNYDSQPPPHANGTSNHSTLSPSSSRAAAIMGSVGSKVGDNLGCFGGSRKKDKSKGNLTPTASPSTDHLTQATQNLSLKGNGVHNGSTTPSTLSRNGVSSSGGGAENVRGCELLWQPDIVQPYLSLLSGCSNPDTLEASAGAIQNLSACYWQPSIDIRAAVRKEKGLPVLVELLRMEVDRVVCAVATALRNLAMDTRNKELIGKYAMKDLVSKLPNGNAQHDYGTSDDTIAAVLATLNEVVSKNADFAKSLLEAQGMERLLNIVKNKNNKFSARVFKFASQLLFNMWQHIELREVYRKAGYKESHFIVRPLARNTSTISNSSPSQSFVANGNNTLSRPMSTQGGTKYEDRTLPRGGARQVNNNHTRPEELPLNDMSLSSSQPDGAQVMSPGHHQHTLTRQQLQHRPPIGGVPIFPPGAPYPAPGEPVYAQVNRDRKKQTSRSDSSSTQALLGSEQQQQANYVYDPNNEPIYPPVQPAGDSWV
ncbi:Catenin delta-2 [Halotydeus destructor]|nr:Catenin delta-2 [Halotydeus destructor]